jgi:hypothetical protein
MMPVDHPVMDSNGLFLPSNFGYELVLYLLEFSKPAKAYLPLVSQLRTLGTFWA